MQSRRDTALRLSDFPDLAIAATATTAELDTHGDTFAAVSACLDTLARLKLGLTATRLLLLLCEHGPARCITPPAVLKISPADLTGIVARLRALALLTTEPGESRREIILTPTEAARKVLASVVALTALGQAANVLRSHH